MNRGKAKRERKAAAKAARIGTPEERSQREWMRDLGLRPPPRPGGPKETP